MKFVDDIKRWGKSGKIAAVDCNGEALSFQNLDERSNKLAVELYSKYQNHFPVIIRGDKENDMITCMIACLKSGHPYVIIPSWFPENRFKEILLQSEAVLSITLCNQMFESDIDIFNQKDLNAIFKNNVDYDCQYMTKKDEIACIFFTSGSTGQSKGVRLTLEGIEAMENWWSQLFDDEIDSPRICNFSSYGFVASLQNVYSFMIGLGGCLYGVSREISNDFPRLMKKIIEINPHYLDCTPSFLNLCMQNPNFNENTLLNMKAFSVGGEMLSGKVASIIISAFPKCRLINGYGASEMTSGPIACEVTSDMIEEGKSLPIGYVAKGSFAYVVDENRKKINEPDQKGELVIISPMVSKGYLNNPEKSEELFFTDDEGNRGYYTQDLVSVSIDGLITYYGRTNNMVKIGGYRVELEEVEHLIETVDGVRECVVVPVYKNENAVRTCAFVVAKNGFQTGIPGMLRIKKLLKEKLPPYMIPQKFQFISEIKKNQNGKVDRKYYTEKERII